MRVRKLDANGDMAFGDGLGSYWIDRAECVATIVQTRLQLQQGEWFLDISDGMPWKTKVLGRGTTATADLAIKQRILATQGVVSIDSYGSSFDRGARTLNVSARISTVFGPAAVDVGLPR